MADLGVQGGQILAEQRFHQHRQHHQIEEPARGLPEPIRARTRASAPIRRTPQTRQERVTASAGRSRPMRLTLVARSGIVALRRRPPGSAQSFQGQDPGQNHGGEGFQPLLDRTAGAGNASKFVLRRTRRSTTARITLACREIGRRSSVFRRMRPRRFRRRLRLGSRARENLPGRVEDSLLTLPASSRGGRRSERLRATSPRCRRGPASIALSPSIARPFTKP